MPFQFAPHINSTLVNFSGLLTIDDIKVLVDLPKLETLQFNEPVDPQTWGNLEFEFFSKRKDVILRSYLDGCDLSFLADIPSVEKLIIESHSEVNHIHLLSKLANLEFLRVGVYKLIDFDFLQKVSPKLKKLSLGETKSKRPSLEAISRFQDLEIVNISGHTKGLDQLGKLPKVQKLSLNRLKSPKIDFIGNLPNLEWLDISLGGSDNLSNIAEATNLKYLDLCWIRRLSDLDFISSCKSLQVLRLDRLKQVHTIPDLSKLDELKELWLLTMKGLVDVGNIRFSPSLEKLFVGDGSNFQPEEFEAVMKIPTLKHAFGGFGSDVKNTRFKKLAENNRLNTDRDLMENLIFELDIEKRGF